MEARKLLGKTGKTVTDAMSTIAVLGMLVLAGCASSSTSSPDAVPAGTEVSKEELHIMLDQCQQIETGLYKCPAFEKDVCSPEYNGQAECVRIGKKGSIFVRSGASE